MDLDGFYSAYFFITTFTPNSKLILMEHGLGGLNGFTLIYLFASEDG
jgi:hypothetical protein